MSDDAPLPLHIRRKVRDHVVARLVAAVPPALIPGGVLKSRVRPLTESELPAILVYTAKEEARVANQEGDLERRLELIIDARVSDGDDHDDLLDELSVAIETAMAGDDNLDGLALDDAILTATQIGILGGEGVATNASAQLTYAIRLYTLHGQPQG